MFVKDVLPISIQINRPEKENSFEINIFNTKFLQKLFLFLIITSAFIEK